jgi:hypothetical protein
MERTLQDDFRNGLRVVTGSGRPGRETRSTSKVAERCHISRGTRL